MRKGLSTRNRPRRRRGDCRRGQRTTDVFIVIVLSIRSGLSLVRKKSARLIVVRVDHTPLIEVNQAM